MTDPSDPGRPVPHHGSGPDNDPPKTTLVSGAPVTDDHRELKPNGQQKDYVVLSASERAKGFVRPVRTSYQHVGIPGPEFPLQDLTPEQQAAVDGRGYVKFEPYPPERLPQLGRYWTQEQIDKIGKGCRTVTTMALPLAETYARDPFFYGGTFCCGCGVHLPVGPKGEFVWTGTEERVGT